MNHLLAFREIPSGDDSASNGTGREKAEDSNPFEVLHEANFGHKMDKLNLAVSLHDHNRDNIWNFYN